MKADKINSSDYWDSRFSTDWESFDGPRQSRFFAQLAIDNLPAWLFEQVRKESLTVADWGCAQGDGTDVLANFINSEQLVGVDFSETAIEQASERYPKIAFRNENWLENSNNEESFDIIFSSNTLEHFSNPYEVLEILTQKAKKAVVLALPYREKERIPEHFHSFFPENIPLYLNTDFQLVWSRIVDCENLPQTQWPGEQVFLIFSKSKWITSLELTLSSCEIQSNQIKHQNPSLSHAAAEQDGQIASLSQTVAERDGQIASLSQAVAERDGQIASLNQAVAERDGQIAISQKNLLSIKKSISWRVTLPIRLAKDLVVEPKYTTYRMLRTAFWKLPNSIRLKLKRPADALVGYFNFSYSQTIAQKKSLQSRTSTPTQNQHSKTENSHITSQNNYLLGDELVIIAGIPFDDVGGGQRAAQLARCALKTGRRVVYLYIYKKFDFEQNRHVDSNVIRHGMLHKHIDSVSPGELLNLVSSRATLLIELPHKTALPYLHLFKSRGMRTVFELIDDWETSLGGDWFNMEIYRNFVLESCHVVGTAKILVKRLQDLGREDALYLPNAANEYIFDKYKNFSRPDDLPAGYRRIGLYFGSLYGEWFAWDYIERAASMNRDTAFVLIGDKPNKSAIPTLPKNVYLLGGKLIEELPAYLAHSDFSLLPFVPGKISDAVSPIKVFEYLFSGSPVVATNLPEILDYPGVLVADTQEKFAQLCNKTTRTNESESENDRFIYTNSWFYRLDKITQKDEAGKFEGVLSVVILIHNNKSIIGRCLESLLLHGDRCLREVIVVDNASIDGGAEYVEVNFPAVKVIRNAMNGCSSGRNLGAQAASGKFLAFFDSDQWFTSKAGFEEALTILERDANVGVVGWGAGWFDASRSDLGGMIADYCQNRAMNDVAMQKGYRSDIGYLGTCGFFLPKAVFDATQGFDVAYDPTCFEDTDMSFQIKQLGLDICYRDLTGIRHQPHQTTKASDASDAYTKLFIRNAEYFKKKWSNYPHFFLDYSR